MNEQTLALVFIFVVMSAIWAFATTKITAVERDEMLDDKEMWP